MIAAPQPAGPGVRAHLASALAAGYGLVLLAVPWLSFADDELGAVRNWQYPLALLAVGACALELQGPGSRLSRPVRALLFGGALAAFLLAQVTHYLSFAINGSDFSIFDLMIWNTGQGRFGYSPIYDVDFFGHHQFWLLLALTPVHRLFASHWFLVLLDAVLLWAAAFPLWSIARRLRLPELLAVLAVVAYWTCPWTAAVLDGGFRPECFYPLLTCWCLDAWLGGRRWRWLLPAVLLLAIKEDAPLYLAGMLIGAASGRQGPGTRSRWREAAAGTALALAVFVLDTGVIAPAILARWPGREPPLVGFWGQWGRGVTGVALGMLTHPGQVLRQIASSRWWAPLAPVLGLPLTSRLTALPILLIVGILGTSASQMMHLYRWYYPLPMLAFVLIGTLERGARWRRRWPRGATLGIAAALAAFPLVGGGYLKIPRPDWKLRGDLGLLRDRLASLQAPLCTQGVLFPQLPYPLDLRQLTPGCARSAGTWTLLHPGLDQAPFTSEELSAVVADPGNRAERLPGGFVLLRGPVRWP